MHTSLRRALVPIVFGCALAIPSRGQCSEWDTRFASSGTNGIVYALAAFDDGSGPALYAGGEFTSAGEAEASNIAKWDGAHWSALGAGTNAAVRSLAVFNGALYAGGDFLTAGGVTTNRIARWDGANWSPLSIGTNFGIVFALTVWNDGTGAALFAGGVFSTAGGVPANSVAKWNGATWSGLGLGIIGGVRALGVFDNGSGSALYAGGEFTSAGTAPAANIAKWNGTSWSGLGLGINSGFSGVSALAAFDDGSGPALYVGGRFTLAGGNSASNVARWSGSAWSTVGAGTNDQVSALTVFDDGPGATLYAGGDFTTAGGGPANRAAKWDGANWSQLNSGTDSAVRALAAFGNKLAAGGAFAVAGRVRANHVATWDAPKWQSVGDGSGLSDAAYALATLDDGTSYDLYAGGKFRFAGMANTDFIAKWNGDDWSGVGEGLDNEVYALANYDDGSGRAIVAGGIFGLAGEVVTPRIAKWDGTDWTPLGLGLNGGPVYAITAMGTGAGSQLFAGGAFTTAGVVAVNRIAKWNGTAWSALGTGVSGSGSDTNVRALAVFDDGAGAALYAGGTFVTAGSVTANHIAKWNGTAWSALGTGVSGSGSETSVRAIAVFDDGTGPALYAAGEFTLAGGVSANRVARWNGTSWSALSRGANDIVHALVVLNDVDGHGLYAAGEFTTAGNVSAKSIARWDGAKWNALAEGIDGAPRAVYALATYDDGSDGDADLYAAGDFSKAGTTSASSIAEWHGCPVGNSYCFGDGIDPMVTVGCPCGNFGAPGHGCANSNLELGGALLTATGTTNPNSLAFTCTGVPNNTLCTFLRASQSAGSGALFGDGIKCLQGSTVRFGTQNAGQNGNPINSVSTNAVSIPAGNTRYYQVQYRNVNASFCTAALFNVSNAFSVNW